MLEIRDFKVGLNRSHHVSFWLWKRDNKKKTIFPKDKELTDENSYFYDNEICYRNLVRGTKTKNVNSIVFVFTYDKIGKKKTLQWLQLAKKNGFLPNYINVKTTVDKGRLSFSLTRHVRNEWYIFLSIVRFLHSEPDSVINTLAMVDKGVDFFTALIISSKMSCSNSNHHFIPNSWCHKYLDSVKKVLNRKINVKEVYALKKFIKTMHIIQVKHEHFTGFTCNTHIQDIYDGINTKSNILIKKVTSKKYKTKLAKLMQ